LTNLYAEAGAGEPLPPLPIPERALTIGAHPDDAEFGAGGTIAKWAEAGCEVSMLILTDGSKGSWDLGEVPAELADRRAAEQDRAAAVLAAAQVVMLDYVDGELVYDLNLRADVCRWIRRLRPTVVLSHDPWRRYMLHPDHRAAGWATVDGVVAARDHLFFPEQISDGLGKHRPEAILLWAPDAPNHWEDVSASFETKIEALLCHSSQARTTMGDAIQSAEAREGFVARIRDWSAQQGTPAGMEIAEAFRLIRP
jgi:LmbE family N-acetylglucosaminyl deacetylase